MNSILAHRKQRIAIIGTTGSGKTTLSGILSSRLGIESYDLDQVKQEHGKTGYAEFRQEIKTIVTSEKWIIDGSYKIVQDVVWPNADLIIWLDYPLVTVLSRQAKRQVRQAKPTGTSQQSEDNVDKDKVRKNVNVNKLLNFLTLMSKTTRKHFKNKREYPIAFAHLGIDPALVLHIRHPRDLENILATLPIEK